MDSEAAHGERFHRQHFLRAFDYQPLAHRRHEARRIERYLGPGWRAEHPFAIEVGRLSVHRMERPLRLLFGRNIDERAVPAQGDVVPLPAGRALRLEQREQRLIVRFHTRAVDRVRPAVPVIGAQGPAHQPAIGMAATADAVGAADIDPVADEEFEQPVAVHL